MLEVKDIDKIINELEGEGTNTKPLNEIYNELEDLEEKIELNTYTYEKYLHEMRHVKKQITETLEDYNSYIQRLYSIENMAKQVKSEKKERLKNGNIQSIVELIIKVEKMNELITERLKQIDTKNQKLNTTIDEQLNKMMATNEAIHSMAIYLRKSVL